MNHCPALDIMQHEWDYLIVLDACRYDFFNCVVFDYLDGDLEKALSKGSSTIEWCLNTFDGFYDDVVYLSANPYINSRTPIRGFNAKEHFHRVIDIWDVGWDESFQTVMPVTVKEYAIEYSKKFPDKRMIIHYIQPHFPFIGVDKETSEKINKKYKNRLSLKRENLKVDARLFDILEKIFLGILFKISNKQMRDLFIFLDLTAKRLGIKRVASYETLRNRLNHIEILSYYKDNLEIVLSHAKELVKELEGTVMITSDHGELLGEHGRFGHFPRSSLPELREVPWFRVTEKNI